MGLNPRSHGRRSHVHTDLTRAVTSGTEDDLLSLLDGLGRPPFLVLLDSIQDPHNLGAILRSAHGAGVDAVAAPRDRSVALTDTVRRVACGAAEATPFFLVTNLARTIAALTDRNVWTIGLTEKASKSLYSMNLTGPVALVLGAEGSGLRRLVAESCDELVSIPMQGTVGSLNVSVAAGVALFEAVRQRRCG